MSESVPQDQIDAAEAYEELHVPALFSQWAPHVLEAAGVEPGHRVLDVACGTGVLAREAARRVGPSGFVAGIDAGAGMLAVAERLSPGVEWRHGMAESLPYPDGGFDAVWDRLEVSEAYPTAVEVLERLAGQPAADALRAPFVLGDPAALAALFESAGVTSVAIASRSGTASFPSLRTMVEADLRGWLPVMGVNLGEEVIQRVLEEAESALAEFVTADGTIVFDSPGHIVTGKRP